MKENSKSIYISFIGSNIVHSFLSPDKTLILKNIMHVPHIAKNLINVSQFALDNEVFFEFHPFACYVKEQVTNAILLKGQLHNELHAFDMSFTKLSSNPSNSHESPTSLNPTHLLNSIFSSRQTYSTFPTSTSQSSLDLWYRRLTHSSCQESSSV